MSTRRSRNRMRFEGWRVFTLGRSVGVCARRIEKLAARVKPASRRQLLRALKAVQKAERRIATTASANYRTLGPRRSKTQKREQANVQPTQNAQAAF